MIETELQWKEQSQLSKEKSELKKVNASLKKKILGRDKKIILRLSCMQPVGKAKVLNTIDSIIGMNSQQPKQFSLGKNEHCLTEPQNYEKQSRSNQRNPENTEHKINLMFPTVERKNCFVEGYEGRPRIIKISLQKLIPLKPEEVKKKFSNKFK